MSIDPALKNRAIALRLKGKSYTQIQRELGLASKGTLSSWFKDLSLPPASAKLLEENIARATERGLLKFNTKRSRRIVRENLDAEREGARTVRTLSRRELMLVGATLYWGEGTKSAGKGKANRLVFTNSDARMIRVYMRFLREVLHVPEEKIGAELHLYKTIDHRKAKRFWSDVTGIPTERFWSTDLVSRASNGKRPVNRLQYGTIAIRVPGRVLFHKVMGTIAGIATESDVGTD